MGNAILAPNLKWYVVTACGTPAVNGYILTFDNDTGLPRQTYADPAKTISNPLRLNLGSDGAYSGPLYWDLDPGLYYIKVYDAAGNFIEDQYNYPVVTPSTSSTVINLSFNTDNHAPNPQMFFWNEGTTFDNTTLPVGETNTADAWTFTRTNTTATVLISQQFFAAGINILPGTPPTYMQYQVTAPSADGQNDFGFKRLNVQTWNNQQITAYMWAFTEVPAQTASVTLVCQQNFGTGGSTTVNTVIGTYTVTDVSTAFSSTFTVPSISGLTIGTGSYVKIIWRFNPSQSQIVGISDFRVQDGTGSQNVWPYQTLNEQYAFLLAYELLGFSDTQGANIVTFSEGAPGQLISVKEAIINTAPEISNMIFCPYMPNNPNQYGQVVDSTTIVTNDNGAYIADGIILQSDGDNIVSKNSFIGNDLNLTIVTAAKKFGIAQLPKSTMFERFIFDTAFGSIVSAFVRAYVTSTATPIFKIALIGWSGTLDQPLKQVVSSWNPVGTNPTLSTGWSYISVTDALTLQSSDAVPLVFEGVDLTTDFVNIGIFCWVDSEDMLVGETFSLSEWGVNQGYTAFQPYRPNQQESINQAQYYFQKSYSTDDPRAWGYQNDELSQEVISFMGRALTSNTPPSPDAYFSVFLPSIFSEVVGGGFYIPFAIGNQKNQIIFTQEMARIPNITFWNPSVDYPTIDNDNAHWYLDISGGPYQLSAGSYEVPISLNVSKFNIKQFSFDLDFTFIGLNTTTVTPSTIEYSGVFVNYVADATIGV